MEVQIQPTDEYEAQVFAMADECLNLDDEVRRLRQEVVRLTDENRRLRGAGISVVQQYRARNEAGYSPLSYAVHKLDEELVGAPTLEVLERPITTRGPVSDAWPPPVGTRVTYVDEDGATWPDCTVRGHGAKGWSQGRVRLDNGAHDSDDYNNNGATMSAWATQEEVRCG